jgi:Ras-related protein Rab-1A
MANIDRIRNDMPFTFKVITVGDAGVGKTSLIRSMNNETFSDKRHVTMLPSEFKQLWAHFDPVSGFESLSYEPFHKGATIPLDHEKLKIQLWDTVGQERYRPVTSSYYRLADVILIVYDATNEESFQRVTYWADQIQEYAPLGTQVFLIANKIDLSGDIDVSIDEGIDKAQEVSEILGLSKVPYFETSAKESVGIENLLKKIASFAFKKAPDYERTRQRIKKMTIEKAIRKHFIQALDEAEKDEGGFQEIIEGIHDLIAKLDTTKIPMTKSSMFGRAQIRSDRKMASGKYSKQPTDAQVTEAILKSNMDLVKASKMLEKTFDY